MKLRLLQWTLLAVLVGGGCSGGVGGGGGDGTGGGGSGGASGSNGGGSSGGSNNGGSGGSVGSNGGSGGSNGGSGGSNGGSGSNGGGTLGNLAIDGTYDVTTQFNLLDALPPDVKLAFSLTLELADSPGKFLLDVANRIPVVKYIVEAINLFSGVRDQIIMAIDQYVDRWSGGLVTTLHGVAEQLEMALRGLSMHSQLVVGTPDSSGNVSIEDTLVDLSFMWNGQSHPYPQRAKALAVAHAEGLKLGLPAHQYDRGLMFGAIIVDLLDNVALPELTGVNSLGALANQLIDCGGISTWIWSYIGNVCIGNTCLSKYIGPNDLAKLCVNTLNFAGDLVEQQLAQLSSPGKLAVGDLSCLAVENRGRTGHADSLTNGVWSLSLPVVNTAINLPGTFSGSAVR